MTDVIEKVARAIASIQDAELNCDEEMLGSGKSLWTLYEEEAQAALDAIGYDPETHVIVPREPTDAMLGNGDMALSVNGVDDSTQDDAAACYRAMIEASQS